MRETPRSLAVSILNRIDDAGGFAEPLLDQCLSRGVLKKGPDRRLLTQIVYGTLRMRGRIDGIIVRLYRGDAAAMETGLRNLLRTALYQLFFTDRVPAFAVVDESVRIAKKSHPAASGLVNAVLRNAIRRKADIAEPDPSQDPEARLVQLHSHPPWLVMRWLEECGAEETLAVCRANNEIPPLTVRVNRLRAARETVVADLRQAGFDARETVFSPDGLILSGPAGDLRETAAYREGKIQIQDEASQLLAWLVDPRPGERVLDACAGVGVKTSHLAERMGNEGRILAVDIDRRKLEALQANLKRLGIGMVETLALDLSGDRDPPGAAFDRILLDAPCSGLGTLRRNPEIKWRVAAGDPKRLAALQGRLLGRAAGLLKPEGILVYGTCSVMAEENEGVVDDFLSRHPDFRPAGPPPGIPAAMTTPEGFFKTRTDRHGTDGFFGAVLRRRS